MKNKIVVIVSTILLLFLNAKIYAIPADPIRPEIWDDENDHTCSYTSEVKDPKYLSSSATCFSNASYYKSCPICGASSNSSSYYFIDYGSALGHTYTDEDAIEDYLKTAATCTTDAIYYKNCSRCTVWSPSYTFTAPNTATGHTADNYGWRKNSSQHYKRCKECSTNFDFDNHSGGTWYQGQGDYETETDKHYKDCSICGQKAYTWGAHEGGSWYPDSAHSDLLHYKDCDSCGAKKYINGSHDSDYIVEATEGEVENPADMHLTYCLACWEGSSQLANKGDDYHTWSDAHGEDSPHKCKKCNYEHETYHWYDVEQNSVAQRYYRCQLTDGYACNHLIEMQRPTTMYAGMPLDDYACADAVVSIGEIPEFPDEEHKFSYSGKVRNSAGATSYAGNVRLEWNNSWAVLNVWTQQSVAAHLGYRAAGLPPVPDALPTIPTGDYIQEIKLEPTAPAFSFDDLIKNDKSLVEWTDIKTSNDGFVITEAGNSVMNNRRSGWDDPYKSACMGVIKGSAKTPSVVQAFDGQSFVMKYVDLEECGWLYDNSFPFGQELYGHPKKITQKIYADLYYCYRTIDGEVPKNGYDELPTLAERVCVYDCGYKTVDVTISPEMDKIDNTGYRYVGASTSVGEISKVASGSAPETTDASVTITVSAYHVNSAAIVTFFVEPVKLSYGHKAIDFNGIETNINATKHQGKDLEFPDYYDKTAGKCIIPADTQFDLDPDPLESLYKLAWPGYILESYKVYTVAKDGTKDIIQEKEYTDETTTYIDFENPENSRDVVNERVPSFYESEKDGYALDKEFYYYYNTPIIAVEHKKYKNNNQYMTTNSGTEIKYITYLQQIINQYAYIDSLITDNVKDSYQLRITKADGTRETFEYYYPNYDLVQVKISEVKKNGTTKHYATLYHDDAYKPSGRSYKVDYEGFPDSFSDSLISIANMAGLSTSEFNTNKNWKIEFVYDEVERVYIQYRKYAEDEKKQAIIYIPNPEKEGTHIEQLTAKILEGGYKYTPTDLNNGKIKLLKYTIGTDDFVRDVKRAQDITSGTTITIPEGEGNKYVTFYFSTDNIINVEYRDENENTIKPSTTLVIPSTGTAVPVPTIPLYEIDGYKHNPNYDGTTTNIDGEKIVLTVDNSEIVITNQEETDHHVIIYYKSKEALKVECRDVSGDQTLQPPPEYISPTLMEITELGVEIPVPMISAYSARYYLKNEAYNGTDTHIDGPQVETTEGSNVSITANGNNQFVIIYYEQTKSKTDLIIEYRAYTPDGPEIREPSKIPLPDGEETQVTVPGVEDYKVKYYVINDNPTENPVSESEKIIVTGDPLMPEQKIIIVYTEEITPPDPDIPTPIVPTPNTQKIYLRANKKGAEEYNVSLAIPTSEDLYVSGDIYAYRFETEMTQKSYTETLKVTINQPYYTDLDKPNETDNISVTLDDLELKYNYYEIAKAELYDLKALHLENDAIKYYNDYNYDTGTFGKYEEGKANFPVSDDMPYLEYVLPTGVDTNNPNARVQINSTAAYTVTKKSNNHYEITIKDIDYYPAVNRTALENQLRTEALAMLEKCTKIKVQTLNIKMQDDTTGAKTVQILTGKAYELPNKAEALNSTVYYIPYTENRAPLESFYYDKDLYVKESAENRMYSSTMAGDYRMVASIPNSDSTTIQTYTPSGAKLEYKTINVESLNIHTPIVNKATLTPSDANKEATQLNKTISNATVLNLEEQFTIEIPNTGNHITGIGYGHNKKYNHEGLTVNGTEADSSSASRITPKSNNNLMPVEIIKDNQIDEAALNTYETEENAKGPAFAEYKLIRFPYDVYLQNTDTISPAHGKPQLFKANEWYNLYSYVKPKTISYTFAIPTWVTDATLYKEENGIHVLIVAENASTEKIEQAMSAPMNVKLAESNEEGKNNTYIIRKTFNTYVSGRLYDLQIRDTDDPGYMNKLKAALDGKDNTVPFNPDEMSLAQRGQVSGYNMGLKLGYRFYFDLKTKGISNKEIHLEPKIYYVSADGSTVKDDITLFYHSKASLYNRLDTNDLNVRMTMTGTHGLVNNPEYTSETITAKQLNSSRVFTTQTIIGKVFDGLTLKRGTEKLPYNNIAEVAKACGFENDTTNFVTSALESESLNTENEIKNVTGHWYGEYYLPASTIVVNGSNVSRDHVVSGAVKPITTGYLVVVFKEITTEDSVDGVDGYLTYSAPTGNTQWTKEQIDTMLLLPNGAATQLNVEGAPMAIYQVNLRANADYETEGTH